MSAQKIDRKNLKHDGFVTWTETALEWVQRNYVLLGVVVLAGVVIVVGSSFYRQGRLNSRLEASQLLYEGQMALEEGAYGVARSRLQECVDRHGGSPFARVARIELAQALHRSGESEAALTMIRESGARLAADDPLRRDARRIEAAILSDLGRYEDAGAVYAELLSGADVEPSARYSLSFQRAEVLRRAGRPDEAVAVMEELRAAVARGDIEGNARELDTRIEFYRALAAK